MNWLQNVIKVAKKAVEVLEDIAESSKEGAAASDHSGSGSGSATSASAEDTAAKAEAPGNADGISDGFRKHLEAGAVDPRTLLGKADAERFLGEPVKDGCASEFDEYIAVEYRAIANSARYLRVDTSAGMPWDYIATEVPRDDGPAEELGDEAFFSGSSLYVWRGDAIFWASGDESVSKDLLRDVVRLALGRIS